MRSLVRVVAVELVGGYVLKVEFSDGLVRDLDFAPTVTAGVLTALADPVAFASVAVDDLLGTITWPQDIDFDPDVLHGVYDSDDEFAPHIVREYRLRPTA